MCKVEWYAAPGPKLQDKEVKILFYADYLVLSANKDGLQIIEKTTDR